MASRLSGELKGREQEQYVVVKSTIFYPIAHSPFPVSRFRQRKNSTSTDCHYLDQDSSPGAPISPTA